MRVRFAFHAVVIAAILWVGQTQLGAPELEVSVYGSATFKQQFCVGSIHHEPTADPELPSASRVVMVGGKSELSLHDRDKVTYSEDTRWSLYSSKGALRSHRRGTEGGIMLEETKTRILKDLNVGGAVKANSLRLKGTGHMKPDADSDHPVLIGSTAAKHLKFGYHAGYTWIQSGKTYLSLNPLKNEVCVGVKEAKKKFTVGGGHLRVSKKAFVGEQGKAFISETHMQFAHGGGWHMTNPEYLKTVNDVPVKTNGGGLFLGNVGIGALPKFPSFRLQVHGGSVLVTDKADKGLTISQTKEGALMRSWNVASKNHEGLLIEGAPLLIQPRSGIVMFGTTVQKENMHVHMRGNLYIHGHMYAMKNLHVKDQATLKHLIMPNLNLKNQPQDPDGDTLVLGHMKESVEASSEGTPWEDKSTPKKPKIVGTNLRLGFYNDYTWIQTHGTDHGQRKPLALNPLGNTVSIGSTQPENPERVKLYVKGNGYVLGTLYVKMKHIVQPEYQSLENQEALEALQQTTLSESMDESETLTEFRDSTLSFLEVPKSLRVSDTENSASVHRLSEMYASILDQQDSQMRVQVDMLQKQANKISILQTFLQSK